MITKLKNARIYDPINKINGKIKDLYIKNGRIIDRPKFNEKISKTIDLKKKVIMAGGIDIHSHIAGGKVNLARLLLPEEHRKYLYSSTENLRSGSGLGTCSSFHIGYKYAKLGYCAVFEPAVLPSNARTAIIEMSDIPFVDKGTYTVLSNDDFLLNLIQKKTSQKKINDYVSWILSSTKGLGVKIVNPGGINAFKFNQRELDLDEKNKKYGITPRSILKVLTKSLIDLKAPHPIHVHGCNLGVPGNVNTTIKQIKAVEGKPMHLTHIQYHSYDNKGDKNFSSGASLLADNINKHKNITCDVGQIMFGQTVTASADTMSQYKNHHFAHPKKWICADIECDAGCGIVPFEYQDKNFVNSLQWAIGLELFLLIQDPWRIYLTTDHPNGAAFTAYPKLIKLLMDKSYRDSEFEKINKQAQKSSVLSNLKREYSLYDIAILTRAGPAKVLGLNNIGHLGVGAKANITVYNDKEDKEEMFENPFMVFKDGNLIVKNGKIQKVFNGKIYTAETDFDKSIEKDIGSYFQNYMGRKIESFKIQNQELWDYGIETENIKCNRNDY
ncbi:MAG: Formyltransferase/hydrolase complex Fhc subunit A [Alphaproteobacteria bacterium MarineAlpha6_Bin6]|nr:formylmethanofuran dehydrogenase subunit A [Pelagibacteraceae bacterium]PPR31874.1 MAG: Formyltransferase/hydrolase complex Fhc subunit A [Alphaproteobacteria bacterium MarineAlpha6_Bin6]PPR32880.1 MAG: Formyltransferase/hydrolase complex Fhc subunit A [Alphaproteobacteria bacterium MarineAlpha6_Bin5]|tara:strand:+ start:299 stop:1963 length:1665 start_codon:yes stop_codon:yes gene_type:complete